MEGSGPVCYWPIDQAQWAEALLGARGRASLLVRSAEVTEQKVRCEPGADIKPQFQRFAGGIILLDTFAFESYCFASFDIS